MTHYHVSLQHLTLQQLTKFPQSNNTTGIPDLHRAMTQYDTLCKTISNLGATISLLPCPEGRLGKLAVTAGRLAILGRTNNHPAQTAYSTVASVLAGNNILKFIEEHGTLDAQDVVRIEDLFLIAITDRTNYEGAAQLGGYLKDAGYDVQIVDGLPKSHIVLQEHLISLGNNTVAVSSILAKHYAVLPYKKIILDQAHKIIPSSLFLNETLIMPSGFPVQEQKLQSFGVRILPINLSEFSKLGVNLSALCLPTIAQKDPQDHGELASDLNDKKQIQA